MPVRASGAPPRQAAGPTYRFGFAMTTSVGNSVVVQNLRKYTTGDPTVETVWAPITHWMDPDPYRWLPGPLHSQAVLNAETRELRRQWGRLDAVVVHAFQLFAYLATFKRLGGGPLLAISQDYAPISDTAFLRAVGQEVRDGWRRDARLWAERAYTRRADLVLARTEWAARAFIDECRVASDRVHFSPHGVDLAIWQRPPQRSANRAPRLLFVGNDFERKGGPLLLDVFRRLLIGRAELHLLTSNPPAELPPGVVVHERQPANSPGLRNIYLGCDIAVLPTRGDYSPLALMEAMACGLPVVSTPVGGVPEIVADGRTGLLVPVGDGRALGEALLRLVDGPLLAAEMGRAGRRRVEALFSAEDNAARMMERLKAAVQRRGSL